MPIFCSSRSQNKSLNALILIFLRQLLSLLSSVLTFHERTIIIILVIEDLLSFLWIFCDYTHKNFFELDFIVTYVYFLSFNGNSMQLLITLQNSFFNILIN